MTTLRHKLAIARIRADGHKLTRREREQIGLPPDPIPKVREPLPFPSDPGRYVWFALTTLPQREAEAAHALSREGYAVFNPTEVVAVRNNRRTRHKRRDRERAILTSMVLAGFAGRWVARRVNGIERAVLVADVPWLDVLGIENVRGFVGVGLSPAPVPVVNVLQLRARNGQRGSTRNWSPDIGDAVEVVYGAFQGKAGQVVALSDGEAQVRLFGAEGVFAKLAQPLAVPETWVRQVRVV
jgi:transcription antitermination factor NusG